MVQVHVALILVGLAVGMLSGLLLWGIRRARAATVAGLTADDWTGKMLVWLLVLAAFMIGAFVSFTLLRP
jgi:hypothetical protein